MDPRDSSSLHNRHPPPQHHPQHGVMMPQPQPTHPFGFGHHFPNSNVFKMGCAAGVPNSGNPNLFSNPIFSFGSLTPVPHPFDSGLVANHHHQPQHQQQQPQTQPPPQQQQQQQQRNGSPAAGVSAAETATVTATVGSEQTKRKRGRPRKYSPASEGITLGLASNSQAVSKAGGAGGENEVREGNAVEGLREKKQRGRPPGSGMKQSDSFGSAGGAGAAFHMVIVPEGENIVSKLVALCQGPRTIFVAGVSGSVRNVTLRQVAGGTFYHEGQFDIATLSGSSCFANSDGSQSNTFNLTVVLAGPDGRLVGGGVTKELIAASSIQLVAGSFIAEKNQSNTSSIPMTSPLPTPAPHMLSFGGSAPPNNSSQYDTGCETPFDGISNGHGYPQNQNPGVYNYGQPWNDGTPRWA